MITFLDFTSPTENMQQPVVTVLYWIKSNLSMRAIQVVLMTAPQTDLKSDIESPNLSDPALYINRELSWLSFNERCLDEALDLDLPVLERVRFLAIFSNNLDEYYMVRVSGLKDQVTAGVVDTPPDGLTPQQQLAAIRDQLVEAVRPETNRGIRWSILVGLLGFAAGALAALAVALFVHPLS